MRGTLARDEIEWVGRHVESCPACSRERQELAAVAAPAEQKEERPGPARPSRWLPGILAAAMAVPAILGARWIHLGFPGPGHEEAAGLSPALYLDLEGGPTRALEPLRSLSPGSGVEAIVISFLPPLTEQARFAFDLEGPHGRVLVRDVPIPELDREGRCSFSFPVSLFESPGDYAIVVRVGTPAGGVRIYPYPFLVESPGQAPSAP